MVPQLSFFHLDRVSAYLLLVVGVLLMYVEPASAQTFAGEIQKGLTGIAKIYTSSRKGIVALTVLAILGMGVAAYFGRFPWKWFWTLSGGLFLISVGGIALSEFLTTDLGSAEIATPTTLSSSIFK